MLKLIANLNMLLRDENVNVVKKAILAMTQLYKVALQVSCSPGAKVACLLIRQWQGKQAEPLVNNESQRLYCLPPTLRESPQTACFSLGTTR